jgi:hypothetical protein
MAFRVASGAASATGVTTLSTPAMNTVSGDAMVVALWTTQAQPFSSISDTVNGVATGNSWTQLSVSPYGVGGSTFYLYVFTSQNVVGGNTHVVTVNISGGSSDLVLQASSFSGRASSGALLDGTPVTYLEAGAHTTHTGPSLTTALNGSDLFCVTSNNGNNNVDSFTAGSGWTIASQQLGSGTTYMPMMSEHQDNQNAGTYSGGWSSTVNNNGVAIILALAAVAVTSAVLPLMVNNQGGF